MSSDNHAADLLGGEGLCAAARRVLRDDTALEPWQICSLLDIDALVADAS